MSKLVPYLVFSGNCKEALHYYAEILGGEIIFMQSFGEAPMEVPEAQSNRIFNAELKAGDINIKASDDLPGYEVVQGTNFSLFIMFPDSESKMEAFNKLAEGGKVLFPVDNNFGMLKDKFGIQWMVVHE